MDHGSDGCVSTLVSDLVEAGKGNLISEHLLNEQVIFSSLTGFCSPMFFLKSVIGHWGGFSLSHILVRILWRNKTSSGYIERDLF